MKPQKHATEEWSDVGTLLGDLYRIVNRLEELFPGRKFTPYGHLVGSIGEALAKHMFDLQLLPASSPGHDAITADGRKYVQSKLTQGTSIAPRSEPEHLIVIRLASELSIEVVYNGRGASVWPKAGKLQSNGTRPISVSKLREIDSAARDTDRVPVLNEVDLRGYRAIDATDHKLHLEN